MFAGLSLGGSACGLVLTGSDDRSFPLPITSCNSTTVVGRMPVGYGTGLLLQLVAGTQQLLVSVNPIAYAPPAVALVVRSA